MLRAEQADSMLYTAYKEFIERRGLHVTEVAEFDVALSHLRVPETV